MGYRGVGKAESERRLGRGWGAPHFARGDFGSEIDLPIDSGSTYVNTGGERKLSRETSGEKEHD
jgi:hypothetical protein